jgi:hypothetical protein
MVALSPGRNGGFQRALGWVGRAPISRLRRQGGRNLDKASVAGFLWGAARAVMFAVNQPAGTAVERDQERESLVEDAVRIGGGVFCISIRVMKGNSYLLFVFIFLRWRRDFFNPDYCLCAR